MKPTPSVFSPYSMPSTNLIVFTAPAASAGALISSTSSKAASLCGTVTFSPLPPAAPKPRTAVSKLCGSASMSS